jgi:hypothetical protein
MSKKLRQMVNSIGKEAYYKKKTEFLEEEIKRSKLLQDEILQKQNRDIKEHEKRMILLDLDIKIKEALLRENLNK